VTPADRALAVEVDLRFARQRWELSVPLAWRGGGAPDGHEASAALDDAAIADLDAGFRAEYARRYGEGALMAGAVVEIVAVRVLGTGRTVRAQLRAGTPTGTGGAAGTAEPHRVGASRDAARTAAPRTRSVLLQRGASPVSVEVHAVDTLQPGSEVCGPALLDDIDTTVWVPPGARGVLDRFRNLDVELPA
jgi:N-methylhydantoinase A